jgi:hypothetical protein
MRIADHAAALQSSQALQQPSSTVHHQQHVVAPESATAAAVAEAVRNAARVNQQVKAEGKTVRKEEGGKTRGGAVRKRNARNEGPIVETESHDGGEPDGEGHLDILA